MSKIIQCRDKVCKMTKIHFFCFQSYIEAPGLVHQTLLLEVLVTYNQQFTSELHVNSYEPKFNVLNVLL